MSKGRGKHKGNSFERSMCTRFSLWVSAGKRKDVFWRTATSGGRATVHKKKGDLHRQSGDICAVSPEGHALMDRYYFELKAYKTLQLARFFTQGKGTLASFFHKTVLEAYYYNKKPVLVAKQDRVPILVVTKAPLVHICDGDLPYVEINLQDLRCFVTRLDDLLQCPYKMVQRRKVSL